MYLLDSNIFIQAKNFYYGFDICPGFWDWMDHAVDGCDARSIMTVYDELADGNDELAVWIKPRKDDGRFLDVSDIPTQQAFRSIAAAVQAGAFQEPAKANFLSKADPWLIAKAKVIGATVVTHEKASINPKKRVPIPNICDVFQVPYIDTFTLLRSHTASFQLAA
jgi:hypothetical protein